jgi:hypothetical protein
MVRSPGDADMEMGRSETRLGAYLPESQRRLSMRRSLFALAFAGVFLSATSAQAWVRVGIGIGIPLPPYPYYYRPYYQPYYYGYPGVVVAPSVVVQPAPMVVQPAPASPYTPVPAAQPPSMPPPVLAPVPAPVRN